MCRCKSTGTAGCAEHFTSVRLGRQGCAEHFTSVRPEKQASETYHCGKWILFAEHLLRNQKAQQAAPTDSGAIFTQIGRADLQKFYLFRYRRQNLFLYIIFQLTRSPCDSRLIIMISRNQMHMEMKDTSGLPPHRYSEPD